MKLFGIIKGNRKNILILLISLEVILIYYIFFESSRDKIMMTSNIETSNTRDEYNQLLVNTYLTRIIDTSNSFYEEYYTTSPVVDYYSIFMKDISSNNDTYYVTFTSKPYLGPHDTIGIDEITFSADWQGNVKLDKFNHLISFYLPDNLKDLEKRRLPGKYSNH
jgi:hypothetical protein